MEILVTFLAALLAALVGAFAGGGSSLVMFPLVLAFSGLAYVDGLSVVKTAAATLTLVAGYMHWQRGKWNLSLVVTLMVGGLIGTAIGTYLVQYQFAEELYRILLGITLLFTAIYLLFWKADLGLRETGDFKPRLLLTFMAALVINILNGLFGGTGMFITIYLVIILQMSFIQAVGYMMFSYAVVNSLQAGYLIATTSVAWYFYPAAVAGAFLGGRFGTKLQLLKGNRYVKIVAIMVMVVLGLNQFF